MFLDSDQLWFVGNLPSLQQYSKIYAQILQRSPPLLEHFAGSRDPTLPTTITAWKQAQADDPAFLDAIPPASLLLCEGLTLFKDPDFPSCILVPPSLREALVRQHHADLQHLSHPKVLTSLARHYHWPTMKTDVRKFLQDCELCENERAKRRLAHGMFSGHHTDKPRSRYAMDFQGQGQATTGESEALAIIDSFTKTVSVIALPNRGKPIPLHLVCSMKSSSAAELQRSSTPMPLPSSCRTSWQQSWTLQAPRARQPAGTMPRAMEKSRVGGATVTAR